MLAIFFAVLSAGEVKRPSTEHMVFFTNTPNELNVYKLYGRTDGNTVFILGGIQGDEPGGFLSADLYPNLVLERGNLIVIPRANFHSIIQNIRGVNGDMNRRFDKSSPKDIDDQIVNIIKNCIAECDLFLNLHDGWGFYSETYINKNRNPDRFGQSIISDASIYINQKDTLYLESMAQKVIAKVNQKIEDPAHYLHFLNTNTKAQNTYYPEQRKSASYFALYQYHIPSFGIETSKNLDDDLLKIRYHNYVINEFLKLMGVEPEHPAIFFEPPKLTYLLISVNENDQRIIVNNSTLRLTTGDQVTITHIESNYDRGLSCDILGVGTEQDFQKKVILQNSTKIIVRKDANVIGEIKVTIEDIKPDKMIYVLEVNGKRRAIFHEQMLEIRRSDKFKIIDVFLQGINISPIKVNLKGFVPTNHYNFGEDRNYPIEARTMTWLKYSIDGKGKIYPIVVMKNNREISRAYISIGD